MLLTICTTLFSLWNTNEGAKSRSKYTMNKHKESVGRVCCFSDATHLSHYSFSIHYSFEMDGKNCIKWITTNAITSRHDTPMTRYLNQEQDKKISQIILIPCQINHILETTFCSCLLWSKTNKVMIFQALDQYWLHPFFNRSFKMTTLTWDLKANQNYLQYHSFIYFYTEISLSVESVYLSNLCCITCQ